jgi:hypothetical protein
MRQRGEDVVASDNAKNPGNNGTWSRSFTLANSTMLMPQSGAGGHLAAANDVCAPTHCRYSCEGRMM